MNKKLLGAVSPFSTVQSVAVPQLLKAQAKPLFLILIQN